MDIKTAFLQGDRFDETRNIVCALPREAGHPLSMVARLKKPAYGLNDAPRHWFNVKDASLWKYGCVPTQGDRCSYIVYSRTHLADKRQPIKQSTIRSVHLNGQCIVREIAWRSMATILKATIRAM